MSKRVLGYDDLRAMGIPWSKFHLERLEKAGRFPRRVHLGEMTVGWLADEVDAFITAKANERSLQEAE